MKMAKNILVYSVTLGLFLVPFIAFMVPETFFFPFITGKGFTFRILVEILFGLFVILALVDTTYRPRLSWITKSVLFFTGTILLADLLGENPYKSIWSNYERMEGFVLIGHLMLYYIVASSFFKTVSDWTRYFNVSIGASVLMSFFAFSQIFGNTTINQGGVRVDATFGNASYFAIYLVLHIFLCLYMLSGKDREKWQRWVYASIAFFESIILYYTATRGAILGLIGGLLLIGIILAWKERENKKIRKFALGSIVVVFLLIVGFMTLRTTAFINQSPVLSRFSNLSFAEFKTQGRYYVWPMAVKGFVERPILGWGQENFNYVFNKYYDPQLYGQEEWFDRTHDVFLDWLIAGGIIGLLAYASMYVALLYYVWRRQSRMSVSEKAIFTGMISAYVFHNIFVFDNLISYIVFFTLLAYMHGSNTPRKEEHSAFYTKTLSEDSLRWVIIPSVVLLTVAMVYFVNVPALKANKTLISAIQPSKKGFDVNLALFKKVFALNSFGSTEALEQLVQATSQIYGSTTIPDKTKQEFVALSKTKIEEKLKSTPNDARYLVFAGAFYNRLGQYDEALKYLERASVESPNKLSIYFEIGSSYIGKGDRQKMFEAFKKAYELKPSSDEATAIYAVGAIYTNNTELLKELLPKVGQERIITDNRILKAYSDVGNFATVVSILNTRIQRDPKNSQNKLSLAATYATMGEKAKAIALLKEVIVMEPGFKEQGEYYIKQIESQ